MTESHLSHELAYRKNLSSRATKSILIAGCGALGSWLSELLACQGYKTLSVLDFDKVDESNIGTQFYFKSDLGRPKSAQLSANIYRKFGTKVTSVNKMITLGTSKILKKYSLVVDTFDNWDSRKILFETCSNFNIDCLHVGVAPMGYAQACWNETYKIGDGQSSIENKPCEYAMASNLVRFAVALAAEIVNDFVDKGHKRNREFWLNNLAITSL